MHGQNDEDHQPNEDHDHTKHETDKRFLHADRAEDLLLLLAPGSHTDKGNVGALQPLGQARLDDIRFLALLDEHAKPGDTRLTGFGIPEFQEVDGIVQVHEHGLRVGLRIEAPEESRNQEALARGLGGIHR